MRLTFAFPLMLVCAAGLFCGYAADPAAASPDDARELYGVYLSRDYFTLEKQLDRLDPHDPRRGFFEGQLDAAFLQSRPAEEKLRCFLELPGTDGGWRREAWVTLVRTEMLCGEYAAASGDSERALADASAQFDAGQRKEMESLLKVTRALLDVPPQRRTDHSGASTANASWDTLKSKDGGNQS